MSDTIIIPALGMPATVGIGSDCYPMTVVDISKSGRRITLRAVKAIPAPGFDYITNQVHTFEEVPTAHTEVWSLRKDGKWRPKGCTRSDGYRLYLGYHRSYSDPSF